MHRFSFIPFFLSFVIASCSHIKNEDFKAAEMVKQLNNSDSFRFDFPFNKYNHKIDSLEYYSLLEYDSLTGISPLFNGVDSIEIRIWIGYTSYIDTIHLLILKNENGKWYSEICTLKDKWDVYPGTKKTGKYKLGEDSIVHVAVDKTCISKSPKSGWNSFIKKIFEWGMLTLPDVNDIEDWKHGLTTHPTGPVIEVATRYSYRYYRYYDIDTAYNNFWQAGNICQILDIFKNEFDFTPVFELCYSSKNYPKDSLSPKIEIKEVELFPIKQL